MKSWLHASLVLFLLLTGTVHAVTSIVLWHSYRGAEREALEKVVMTYNSSHQDIQIQLLQVPYDALRDKITAAIPRGKGPDLFIYAQDRIGDWAVSGVIQPIGFWATEEIRTQFPPRTIEALTFEDELYGLPLAFKSTALYYNRNLISEPPKTTLEMIALAKKLTDPQIKRYGLVYENSLTYYQSAFFFGFGGGFFNADREPMLDQPANIKALQFTTDLLNKHGIMPKEINNSLVTSLFNEGKAAMVISGPWFRGEIDAGIYYGVAVLPSIPESNLPLTPFLSVEAIQLSSRSEHPKEAFDIMTWLTGFEAAAVMGSIGKQPVANLAAYDDPRIQADPWVQVFRKQLDHVQLMPTFPEMRMMWTPCDIAIGKALSMTATPEEALREAQKTVRKDIKNYRE